MNGNVLTAAMNGNERIPMNGAVGCHEINERICGLRSLNLITSDVNECVPIYIERYIYIYIVCIVFKLLISEYMYILRTTRESTIAPYKVPS